MKIRKILLTIFIFALIILFNNVCFAKDLDQINKYYITVDPRTDGTLDISYHIEWEVLDSTSEGPLTWIIIGIPNSNVDSIKTSSKIIRSATYYGDIMGGSYVRIDFKKSYYKGDIITFDFSIHQKYMYNISGSQCIYTFTPGWFDDIVVKDIMVYWNAKNIKSSSAQETNSDNYLVWSAQLAKGAKLKTQVIYDVTAFATLNEDEQMSRVNSVGLFNNIGADADPSTVMVGILIITVVLVCFAFMSIGVSGGRYSSHSGYAYGKRDYYDEYTYYHTHHHRRTPPNYRSHGGHSGSSCVSSCACACACAGGGRAGCSKKDFYGTNLRTRNIKRVLNT